MMVSPFLDWAEVTVFGSLVGLPGIFLHGAVLLAVGSVLTTAILVGVRWPGFHLILAAGSAWVTYHDWNLVVSRTEYTLGKIQLWLADINSVLSRLNIGYLQVFTKADDTSHYAGQGLWVAALACSVVSLGALVESVGYTRRGKTLIGALVGRPSCSECGFSVAHSMRYCPGCGRPQNGKRGCSRCGANLRADHRFCHDCGQACQPEQDCV